MLGTVASGLERDSRCTHNNEIGDLLSHWQNRISFAILQIFNYNKRLSLLPSTWKPNLVLVNEFSGKKNCHLFISKHCFSDLNFRLRLRNYSFTEFDWVVSRTKRWIPATSIHSNRIFARLNWHSLFHWRLYYITVIINTKLIVCVILVLGHNLHRLWRIYHALHLTLQNE